MLILGIETSHDDTSIALLEDGKVIDMLSISQIDIFKEFGGTIPEISSREHVKNIALIHEYFKNKYDLSKIDYIAYTEKPGLIGTLQVGYLFASALAIALKKPIVPINHLDGHFFSASIDHEIKYPALCLLVSGGHTQLIYAKNIFETEIIGETLDDAVGEAFDKVAVKTNLGFPGGPIIDKTYQTYSGDFISLPHPVTENELDFSFSGLKTSVLNQINKAKMKGDEIDLVQLACSFQESAISYLINKTKLALTKYKVKTLILGGGVSANKELRKRFQELHDYVIVPDLKYATDNGAMIAQTAYLRLKEKNV
ncbi:tRNA (adenosine(37)-N6)-threonylcarbamoyltransferase complex transferase subunit TsaD [Mycoplasmopsis pullorum]|uniref:tRNA N6-adenosine threonylcarbamoyltransferase n=1 Tax=Mycoplasmopsis pullorum TaxID=48003 RepID=A0A1L4FS82_9BACT|nr:tRNA (adenosine(37)-N6)-threonylcarbamoyltransferase complex transferase subunit TsaD [Mycoplasmopsis pullorum]APJ38477.1 tRNA (adenosine(37)-N6)-threonylcarbamoyltransferase complex transferase subunit TsaD [Mycoplasmopsis pullorum]TNK82606.1 tRNA (adenosine(37)-N6)-threonylcarbamoyltransferase complex transferase subunit TsaD [Mycoplasmopsis pullorum]TNK83505.1 tRNA (adenosine(37)-N6)-threonylcarbamoyltransferase complex transferase subunit TsaD [Mycoplasmopsis pullorum]TNK84937.1 tRNA (ad